MNTDPELERLNEVKDVALKVWEGTRRQLRQLNKVQDADDDASCDYYAALGAFNAWNDYYKHKESLT
jgi:hypothetical protein